MSAIDNASNESALSPSVGVKTPKCTASNGIVYFSNHLGSEVDAPVNWPDGSGAGAGVTAQLLLVNPDGRLVLINPTTEFRTNSSTAAHYVKPIVVEIPGVPAGSLATLRLRAWRGDDFDTAQARGESADFVVQLGGGIVPPSNLDGLQGFTLLPVSDAPKPPDVPSPGCAMILLQHLDRTLANWCMDGTTIRRGSVWNKLEPGWEIIGAGDFNHDGQPDLLLQHADRTLGFWMMDGDSVREGILGGKLPDGWEIATVGDFDGDGNADIILQRGDGRIAFWFMRATSVREGIVPFSIPTGWRIVAAGDFNQDGKSDIVLLGVDRSLGFWFMDGARIVSARLLLRLEPGWEIAGTGDFNHDRGTDLLLKLPGGSIAFWFMNGTSIQNTIIPFAEPAGWTILQSW